MMGDLARHATSSATWHTLITLPWLKTKFLSSPPAVATMIQIALKETSQMGTRFSRGFLQLVPSFPSKPLSSRGWISWIKCHMDKPGYDKWHAYTDDSWTPPALSDVPLFATTNPGSKAGTGIVFFPTVADWNLALVYCIEINEGAEVNCQDVYMMEVLTGVFLRLNLQTSRLRFGLILWLC